MQLVNDYDYDSFKQLLNTEPFIYSSYYDYIIFENFVIENMGISDNTVTSFNISTYSDYYENDGNYFSLQKDRLTELYLIIENKCLINTTEFHNLVDIRILLETEIRKQKLKKLLDI